MLQEVAKQVLEPEEVRALHPATETQGTTGHHRAPPSSPPSSNQEVQLVQHQAPGTDHSTAASKAIFPEVDS